MSHIMDQEATPDDARLEGLREAIEICRGWAKIYRSTGASAQVSAVTNCALDIEAAMKRAGQ